MSDYEEEYEESASSLSSVSEPEPEAEYEETRDVVERSESRSSSRQSDQSYHSDHSDHSSHSSHHSSQHSGSGDEGSDSGGHGGGFAAFGGGHGGSGHGHGHSGGSYHGSGGGGGAEKKVAGILGGVMKHFKRDKDKEGHNTSSGGGEQPQAGYAAPSGYPCQDYYQGQPGYQNQQPYSHDQYASRDRYYTSPQGPPVNGYAPPTEAFSAMGLGGPGYQSTPGQGYGGYPDQGQGYGHSGGYGYGGPNNYGGVPELPHQQDYYPTAAGHVPQAQYQAPRPPYGPPPHAQYYHPQRGDDDGLPHQQHYGPTFTDPQTGEVAQAFFEYSRCNGTKKALLIGINYFGTSGELAGCINDVRNVQKFICERFGYQPADIVILTDEVNDPRTMPTRENIINGMRWLVEGAKRDDSLFLHYSGHGTQTEDLEGDEGDDDDEAICPVDYQSAGLIVDDESDHELVVKPLPAGCRLTAIFDSCHSGTVMDLPYAYTTEGKIKEPDLLSEAREGLLGAGMDILKGDTGGIMSNLFGAARSVFEAKQSHEKTKKTKTSPADVIQWAGCKDSQTSADTQEEGKATGAMSYAFIAALTRYPNQSYQQLLTSISEEMKGKYTQIPQLSACHPIDTDLEFVA
ncbi:hypothetical protein I316_06860 [Kwoniella heveanensis BCC8398]|uniref:Peptidase C14 caspase domain-containing protein n=1 Tax=Kwoniella heveanensis BCC8398 TaxID=1296120 RepID=A0A1B9GKF5_9TREE|nr:hypothetical protein I316_06860 [Kwoniella heveanensis BCC8398]